MQARNTFALGLASIIALLGLGLLLFLFGNRSLFTRQGWPLLLQTDDAAGLRVGGAVYLNGVHVGRIVSVQLQEHDRFPVRVEARIDATYRIHEPAHFEIVEPLIGGSATLNIVAAGSGPEFPVDGSRKMESLYESQLEQMTDLMTDRFTPVMEAMEAFQQFSETYADLGEELQQLLAPQEPGVLDPANLRTSVVRINELVEELTESVKVARTWLNDEQLRGNVTTATEKASRFFDQAGSAAERFEALAAELEQDSKRVSDRLLPVLEETSRTLEEVRRVAQAAREGDGTVAQLLNNPDLYNSLDDAARRLEQTATELQLLIEKWKAEGVSVNW